MAGSAVGDNTAGLLGAFHDKRILEVLEDSVAYYQLADMRPLATRNGNTITFHTLTKLNRGDSLTEGEQPAAEFMTAGSKTATIRQFGQVVAIADVMAKSAIADMINLAVERLGDGAARTIDTYIQDRLFSEFTEDYSANAAYHAGPLASNLYHRPLTGWYDGVVGGLSAFFLSADATKVTRAQLSAFYCAAADNADTVYTVTTDPQAQKLNLKKIRKLVTDLKEANVRPYSGGKYALVVRPKAVNSIHEDPEWKEWNRYNDAEKMFNYEVGMVEGCRIIESTNQMTYTHTLNSGLTAYMNTILGAQAFAVTEFSGDTGIKTYTVPFDNKDSGNVLQQNAYVGYKWTGVCKVLDSTQGYGLITFNG
jgi:N4-gp56 family major capsid protein